MRFSRVARIFISASRYAFITAIALLVAFDDDLIYRAGRRKASPFAPHAVAY